MLLQMYAAGLAKIYGKQMFAERCLGHSCYKVHSQRLHCDRNVLITKKNIGNKGYGNNYLEDSV